jgi:AcrR family transcriptional regulator
MSRPAGDADKRLIRAAREMMPRTGIAGLKVREVARKAGVNLGLFHYHFGNMRAFRKRVLQEFYGDFFGRLLGALEAAGSESPRERLRRVMLTVVKFIRENRAVMIAILRDILDGDPEAVEFIRANFPKHVVIVVRLVRDCQKASVLRRMPLPTLISMLLAGVASAPVAVGLMERLSAGTLFRLPMSLLTGGMITDTALEERVDIMLNALSPTASGRKS